MVILQIPASDSSVVWELIIWQTRSWQIYPPSSMAISQIPDSSYFIPTLRAQYLADQGLWQIYPPVKWQFHRFLLWQLIFHSYSESSSFGRPGPDRSTSHPMAISQILALTAHSYSESSVFGRPGLGRSTPHQMAISQIPALTAHYIPKSSTFGRPGLGRSTPPSNGNFTDYSETHISFLLWELIIWQTRSWQIYPPPSNGNFTDSCSTLRAHIWQTKCWQIYPHHQMAILQIPALTAHISFLLWELNHLADQVLTDLPPIIKWQFHRFLCSDSSYSESSSFGRPGLGRSTPHQMAISQIPALTAHYSKSSTFDRPGLGRSDPPHQMAISQIPLKFIFHSYSESSTFGRPGLGRSTPPHQMAISQIPALLWKLIFVWQINLPPTNGNFTDVGRSTSPSNGNFTDSCSALRAHIYHPFKWCRFLSSFGKGLGNSQIPVKFIFHSYSESSTFGRPGLGRSTPPNGNFTDSCSMDLNLADPQMVISLLWHRPSNQFHRFHWQLIFHSYSESSTFGRPGLGRSTPHLLSGNFTDSYSDNSYFIPTLRAYHLADQVSGRSTPHIKWQFHRFLLYSESSYLADQVLADQPPVKWQFHRLLLWQLIFHSYSESSTFGRPGLGRSTPHHQWQFYRFLLYPESSYLSRLIMLADLPPHQMAISQIPVKFIFHSYSESSTFGRPGLGQIYPHQMAILQIPDSSTLRAQHLADQVLADLPPCQMAISQIPALKFSFHSYSESSTFGRPCSWQFHRSTPPSSIWQTMFGRLPQIPISFLF